MAEKIKQESNVVAGSATEVLAAAYAAGRKVRFWLGVGGDVTGVFQARNGKTVAVSTHTVKHLIFPGTKTTSKVYYGMDVGDAWRNPCKVATKEAIEAYKAEELAVRAKESEESAD